MDFTYLKTLQPFLAADMARVYSNSVSLSHLQTLQSLAIGLRFSDRRYYTMDVSVAQPVGDKPTNAGPSLAALQPAVVVPVRLKAGASR